jgi:hypothetical protein
MHSMQLLPLLFAFAVAPTAPAQSVFDAPWRSFQTGTPETGSFPIGATTADVNGDSLPDAIVAQNVPVPGVRVLLNLGSTQGTSAMFQDDGVLLPLTEGALEVVAADLDGDGDIDLAASNTQVGFAGTTIVVFRNNGNGTFGAGQSFAAGSIPYGMAAADLDDDGDVDLVATNYGINGQGTTIHVLRNNGSATFAAPIAYVVPSAPARVRAGDLDGDGDADLVASHDGTRASVLFNAGDGTFGAAVVHDYASSPSLSTGVTLVDPDADGDLDIVFAGYYDQAADDARLVLLRNDGSGAFATELIAYASPDNDIAIDLVAVDLDGDGRGELVGSHYRESGFVVFRDDDAGSYLPAEMYASLHYVGQNEAVGIAAADLDRDGDPDVLTTGRSALLLSVHENLGDGHFPELAIKGHGTAHYVLDLGDVDADGDLDVVTSHGGAAFSDVAVYRNAAGDGFLESYRATGQYAFAKLRELTGDGVLDLLFVSGHAALQYDFFTARGNGNGTFATPVRHVIDACGRLAHPEAFDLDADGDLDVVSTEGSGCPGGPPGGRLHVSLNNGDGTFQTQTIFIAGIFPHNTTAGDLDADGKLDVVTATSGGALVLFGNGDGTFQQPGLVLPSGDDSENVLVLDLDADGNLDLATLHRNSVRTELVLLFGNGAGAFTPVAYPQFPLQPAREWLASGDVDSDGDRDLLSGGGNGAVVFLNDGAGALTLSGRYGIGANVFSMHCAELTGDERVDLIALCAHELPASGGNYGLVLVEGRDATPTGTPFCFGDGTGTPCPCGNSGQPGHGCANSFPALGGARLSADGEPNVSNDSLVLHGASMPPSSVLYFQGVTQVGQVFGDGLRCVADAVIRLGTKLNSAAGTSQYPEAGDIPISIRGSIPAAGATRNYQAWYRNAAAFCTPLAFNLSNGFQVVWRP